ncbi:regulatory protein, luxR family [Demequina mangrovi]|uniref:Regulatory protein, luxR family n=2 Tax=Demequina mangrovi TaxID=1043493 RepID=A0A1H6UAL0_9MICO|nr:regulatory protein, luxR family [Demequina mangrovi]
MSAAMVGRAAELGTLADALADGAAGEPRAVLVRGEAGIGKSRLVHEALARPAADDAPRVTAVSHCIDLGPVGAPLVPVRRLLRDLHAAVGDAAFRAAAGREVTLHALAALVPEIGDDAAAPPPVSGSDWLADAVERLVEGLTESTHVVLVVEDIHWADAATLALLRTLATTLRGSRLTVVMTFRTDDVDRGPALRETLAELQRSRAVTTVDMARLDRASIAAHARQILDRSPTEVEVDVLERRSEGVPFFVEELLGIPDGELPRTLREVVLAGVERLGPEAQEVVRVAAVGGARLDHASLAGAWHGTAAALATGLRAAHDGHVLTAEAEGYVFRHALIREAVYERLLPHEREETHRRFAETMQARVERGDVAAAAPAAAHWLAARDVPRSFDATVDALAHARASLPVETAARLGERLIELWPQVPDAAARAGTDEAALRLQVAKGYHSAHRLRACLAVTAAALAAAPRDDADTRVPLLLVELSAASETELRGDAAVRIDEIDRLLAGRDDASTAAWRAQARGWRSVVSRGAHRSDALDEAVALAASTGDDAVLAEVLVWRARNSWAIGAVAASIADLDRVLELCPEPTDTRLFAVNNLVCDLLQAGRYDDAIALGMAAVEQTADAGRERAGAHILSNTAEAFISAGRVEDGLAAARRAVRLARGDSIQVVLNAVQIEGLGLIWADRREDYEALLAREPAVVEHAELDLQWTGVWNMMRVDAAVAAARDARAAEGQRILATALPLLDPLEREAAEDAPGDLDVLMASGAALVEAAREAGVEPRPELAARLRRLASMLDSEEAYLPVTTLITAHLAEPADRVRRWNDAYEASAAGLAPRRYAHLARLRLGEALVDAGRRDEAIAHVRGVAGEAPSDGVDLVARWARELLARLGHGDRSSRPDAGLTAREAQVLALVAEGLTNVQIGERLFISRKTASVHVSAILAKIGAANRTEAAAYFAALPARHDEGALPR